MLSLSALARAQKIDPPAAPPSGSKTELQTLPPFTVSSGMADSYGAKDAISATRIAANLIDTPQSVQVLTREMLDDVNPTRIADAMEYVAGVAEGSTPYFGDRTSLRGFSASSRVVDNFLFPSVMNQDPITVERIEILEGPNAIIAPTGLAGGTVNVVTKLPQFSPSREVTVTGGAFDAQRIDYDLTGPVPFSPQTLAYRVLGAYQDTDGFVNHWKNKVQVLAPELTWRPAHGTDITVRYEYDDRQSTIDPSVPIDPSAAPGGPYAKLLAGLPRDVFLGDPSDQRDSKVQLIKAVLSQQLGDHVRMRLAAFYADYTDRTESPIGLVVNSQGGAVNPFTGLWTPGVVYGASPTFTASAAPAFDPTNIGRSGSYNVSEGTPRSVQNDYVALFQLGPISTQTVAGWAYNGTNLWTYTRAETLPAVNAYAPVYGEKGTLGTVSVNSRTISNNEEAYAMERLGLFSDRLYVSGGLTRYGANNNLGSSVNLLTGVKPTETHLRDTTYMGGVVWKVRPDTSLYYGYSENASPTSDGNPDARIVWQTGKQNEFGVKSEFFDGRFSVTLDYYKITLTNFTLGNPAHITDLTQPPNLLVSEETHGEELNFSGALTKNISLLGGIANSKLRDPAGRRQRGVPDRTASAFVSYKFLDGSLKNLGLSLGVQYSGSRPGDLQTGYTALGVPIQPTFYLAPYTLVNAAANYSWGRYTLRLFVDNLTDTTYILAPGSRTNVNMGPGINERASLTFKF